LPVFLIILLLLGNCVLADTLDIFDRTSGIAQAGCGQAGIAYPDSLNAPYWNPANVSLANTNELGLTYYQRLEVVQHFSGGTTLALKKAPPLAFNFVQESIDEIPETVDIGGEGVKTGSFSDISRIYGMTSAFQISNSTALGGTLKLHTRDIQKYSANGYSADLGLIHKVRYNTTLGVTARNIFSNLSWSTGTTETFEKKIATGIYVTDDLGNLPIGILADYEFNLSNTALNAWYLGTEVWIAPEQIALRTGTNAWKDITCGLGLRYRDFRCDVAYIIKNAETKFNNEILFSTSFLFTVKQSQEEQTKEKNEKKAKEAEQNQPLIKESSVRNNQAVISFISTENIVTIAVMDKNKNVSYYTPDLSGSITFPAQPGEYTIFIQHKDETISKERILL
jgi:hypothetical protein